MYKVVIIDDEPIIVEGLVLRNPSYRICDIADEVGFQDLAHFSRVLKKMKGVSANEYRNHLT